TDSQDYLRRNRTKLDRELQSRHNAKYETELRYEANVTGMISYTHIAYKSCFRGFRSKESDLMWLWSYILRHWCCSQAILTLLFV
ncbi:hypothetical protein HID58_007186, partial [Brassica napus]